jgi:hypothetical protein
VALPPEPVQVSP